MLLRSVRSQVSSYFNQRRDGGSRRDDLSQAKWAVREELAALA